MTRALLALLPFLGHLAIASSAAPDFDTLLAEAVLRFDTPSGFHQIPIAPDYVMPYEKRLRSDDDAIEVRYAIRPLKRIEIAYEDPHSSAPRPNDLFEMLFRTLGETLAGKAHVFSRAYLPADARKQFNAGWASIGVFDIVTDVSPRYRQAVLIAIHQNDKADAYTLILTNDLAANKARIKSLRNNLRFRRFDKPINRPPSPEALKRLPMIPEREPEDAARGATPSNPERRGELLGKPP
jgi:hypothetical protein